MTAPPEHGLFAVLALFTKLYYKPVPEPELVRGLSADPKKGQPELFTGAYLIDNFGRAAERAGLKAELHKRSLDRISPLILPAILIMKDGSGCILDSFDETGSKAALILPDSGEVKRWTELPALSELYSGYVFFLGERFEYKGKQARTLSAARGHWFWNAIKLCFPLYLNVLIASIALNIFSLISPLFTMNVYDRVVPNNAMETLWVLSIGVMIVTLFDAVLKVLRTYFIETAAKKSDIIISARLFETVLDLRMDEAPRNIGSFASNLKEFDTVRNFLTSAVMLALVDLPFTILLLAVIQYLAGKMVFIPLAMMLIILLYTLLIRRSLHQSVAAGFEAAGRKNSLVVESVSGLADIKLLNAYGAFQWRWENLVAEAAGKGLTARLFAMSIPTLTSVLIQVNTVISVIMGVYMIKDQELTMGGMIAVMMISSRAIAPMGQVVSLLSSWEQTKLAFDALSGIMNKITENASGKDYVKKDAIAGEIEFRDVTFTYPGSERPVLKNITFAIRRGERVAIIGRTGSGKSTIQKLILGLFHPKEGAICIDGIDATQLSPLLLRRNVNYVPQDFHLFAGTLRENITLRAPHSDDMILLSAALTGGLENYIRSCPRGIDTPIEERGTNLSMGQRQGVAIARAFLVQAPVIILDEPASSMDGTTEAAVKENLKKRMEGRTTILVTHKTSMLDLVARVLVLEGGKIVFDGLREDFFKNFAQTREAPVPVGVNAPPSRIPDARPSRKSPVAISGHTPRRGNSPKAHAPVGENAASCRIPDTCPSGNKSGHE